MTWPILITDHCTRWWQSLPTNAQQAIAHDVDVLAAMGPTLGRPYVDRIHGSQFPNMKELRTKHRQGAYRILFAFDPLRRGVLLVGGDKAGDHRWYDKHIPIADHLFQRHLNTMAPRGDAR